MSLEPRNGILHPATPGPNPSYDAFSSYLRLPSVPFVIARWALQNLYVIAIMPLSLRRSVGLWLSATLIYGHRNALALNPTSTGPAIDRQTLLAPAPTLSLHDLRKAHQARQAGAANPTICGWIDGNEGMKGAPKLSSSRLTALKLIQLPAGLSSYVEQLSCR
jgi:hypothetical protein